MFVSSQYSKQKTPHESPIKINKNKINKKIKVKNTHLNHIIINNFK